METTLRLAGLSLLLFLAAGLGLAFAGYRRQTLDARQALARFLYGGEQAALLGPPQISASRQLLLFLGVLAAGVALALVLLPLNQKAALLAGGAAAVAGLLWARSLSGSREKQEAAEDVLPLVAHLRQTLGRGETVPDALHAFARDVQPGRALAHRIDGCLAAATLGADLYQAFEAWVARDDRHLQALAGLLREVKRSREPQVTLDRLARKIVADVRQEMRNRVKRQALASIVVTVVGLFPPLMLALLEPAAVRLAQSVIFGGF
jgi:hypothetical protein